MYDSLMSLQARIVEYVDGNPGKSATEIAHALSASPATVSSILRKLVDVDTLRRDPHDGPRGGWTYFVTHTRHRVRRQNVWARLLRGVSL